MGDFLRRLGLVCRVAGGLLVALLLLNLLLQATTRIAPAWLPYRLAGTGFRQDIVQRIEAAEAQYRDGRIAGDRALCVLIGLSGLREAADLKAMSAATGSRCRYLGLSGAGGAIDTMVDQTSRLLQGSLRPDVAVIGLAEYLLVKPLPPQPGAQGDTGSPSPGAARRRDWRQWARSTRDALWFVARRRDVSGAVESLLLDAKQTMLRTLGADRAAELNPTTDPWREMIRLELPPHPSEAALREGIAGYEARHLYEPRSYEPQRIDEQANALAGLVTALRQRGAIVIVAIMPEHSRLRARLPDAAMQALRRSLDAPFAPETPRLLDLRDAVPDSGFTNISHVNAEGRTIVSQRLAAAVAEALAPGAAPLMSQPRPSR